MFYAERAYTNTKKLINIHNIYGFFFHTAKVPYRKTVYDYFSIK